ncbi:dipeptide/oligopeptide/nickel ABC transporter permease/ATP-binding protein [Paramicrobacterium chengjingii]|uniref:dipeptide/oligopeptide/nickel ABC transporter permease/ATP-binding protein n=1 Tax=Paramicrobacterium chengjingii TaxID=2769067 RepID=UPI0014216948|nr:dipeptide/oligopeptide/nickel ABC transporter permease/ATP-binding protein [Microbacterium chengjingii]
MSEPVEVNASQATIARTHVFVRIIKNPMGLIAITVLGIMILVAIFAQWIAPFDVNFANISKTLAGPDATNLLGSDSAGRDTFSRLVLATQTTLLSAVLCAVVAIVLGLPAGLVAGYYGGPFDSVANWVVNVLMAIPGIILLLTIRAAFGPSVWISMIAFGVLISPGYFRLTRTAVQSVRNELYVDAARVSGLSDGRIIARHIFSVARAPIIIQTASVCGVAIGIQSGLEFLGLGDPSVATWGVMLAEGFANVYLAPYLLIWPAVTIGLAIGSLVLLGNAVRDALEDREKVKTPRTRRNTLVPTNRVMIPAESGSDHLVEVSGLAVGYPQSGGAVKEVVSDVSFIVDRGEVLGIVGESGSGKTQTAFSILGLLPNEARIVSGSIQFDGQYTVAPGDETVSQSRLGRLRGARISYIPQEPMSNLDPAYTVGSQLVAPMVRILGISKSEAKKRALQLLADVGIENPQRTLDAYPHEISGGMAQRVLIAGAISCEPDLIIADEPTTALDVTVQAEVLDLIRDLQKRLGVGVILVTHNFGVVADLCDRVVVMEKGRLVEGGEIREVLHNPQDPYTKALLSSMLEGKEPMTMLVTAEGGSRS